jgi:recombination protein RecT
MNTQNAVAKIDNSPASLVTQYRDDFAQLLPSHINADMWVRLATGALRKDKALAAAAQANPGSFMAALSDAARLGLEPATSQYYLTPRKVKGRDEVLGIVGYQGLIELMYRAGAVSSIVAECVYSGDTFTYSPGVQDRPIHGIDWDAENRGDLRLVYAYAVMKDGATSKVVVLNKAAITKIKGSSSSARSDYSPWSTHPDAMWLKSAIRQLSKYVPTSAEYIREQLRAVRDVAAEPLGTSTLPAREVSDILHTDDYDVDTETGELIYEAEILGDES